MLLCLREDQRLHDGTRMAKYCWSFLGPAYHCQSSIAPYSSNITTVAACEYSVVALYLCEAKTLRPPCHMLLGASLPEFEKCKQLGL